MATRFPPLFISHGSPMLYMETNKPAYRMLANVINSLGPARPRAIVIVSAHWEEPTVAVTSSPQPQQIYDFYGFPSEMYAFTYRPPGDPALAHRIVQMLKDGGVPARADDKRGLDHGAWSPLAILAPKADIPVIQVALQQNLDPAFHLRVGHALAPLQYDGVLLIGSGGATHNLGALRMGMAGGGGVESWAARFDAHLRDVVVNKTGADRERAIEQLLAHPDVNRAHPTKEHLAPVYVVAGASGDRPGRTLHEGMDMGSFSMAAYAF